MMPSSTVPLFLALLVLPVTVSALCYNPMVHGFMPDVILPSMLGSGVRCPSPRVFDPFLCLCVDPVMVKVGLPGSAQGRTTLQRLSGFLPSPSSSSIPFNPAFPKSGPHLVGLPDMHVLGQSISWGSGTPPQQDSSPSVSISQDENKDSASLQQLAPQVVPALNPYGSFNIPANSKMMALAEEKVKARKSSSAATRTTSSSSSRSSRVRPTLATMTAKERELLEKRRWREQLRREAAAEAAVQMAAVADAMSSTSASSSGGRRSGLEVFMRDTLRRILYG